MKTVIINNNKILTILLDEDIIFSDLEPAKKNPTDKIFNCRCSEGFF